MLDSKRYDYILIARHSSSASFSSQVFLSMLLMLPILHMDVRIGNTWHFVDTILPRPYIFVYVNEKETSYKCVLTFIEIKL